MLEQRRREHVCRVCHKYIKPGETPWYAVGLTGDLQRWHKECDEKREKKSK